jgi:hypothetical protein
LRKRIEEEIQDDERAFIKYIKEDDVETCVNSLFVLTNSDHYLLEILMRNMKITRREVVDMLRLVLKQNIDEYKMVMNQYKKVVPFSYSYGGRFGYYKPPALYRGIESPSPNKLALNRSRSRSVESVSSPQKLYLSAPSLSQSKSDPYGRQAEEKK